MPPAAAGAAVNQITVSGSTSFADGTPIKAENIQYQLILDGADMFHPGIDGCTPTPDHVAGTTIQTGKTDPQGAYSVSVPVNTLYAAVVRNCKVLQLNASQIEGLTIKASILADANSCAVYCSAQGTPGADCVNDCSSGNRTLGASQSLTADQTVALIQNGKISWDPPLTFSELGPTLDAGAGPDLVVDEQAAESSQHIDSEYFAPGACEIADACVRGAGQRRVLRFDGTIENLGSADLVIGSPQSSSLFQTSNCHKVPLLKNIMLYELVDPSTNQVVSVDGQQVVGRKQGFCMMDISQINASAPQGKYDCNNQGITEGWADVYDSDLDCQFLDITGVPSGAYNLRLTVNPDGLFNESNTTNNTVNVPVTIPDSD
jgi:hypothetical protein